MNINHRARSTCDFTAPKKLEILIPIVRTHMIATLLHSETQIPIDDRSCKSSVIIFEPASFAQGPPTFGTFETKHEICEMLKR